MNILYWLAVFICIIAFGGMTSHSKEYSKYDRIWVPLIIISLVTAVILSGKIITGVITGIVLFFGNGLFWGVVWSIIKDKGKKFRQMSKEN